MTPLNRIKSPDMGGIPILMGPDIPDQTDGVLVGLGWVDISGTPVFKLCTSVSPITFVEVATPETHAIAGAQHTLAGGTVAYFLRVLGSTTLGFEAIEISRGGTVPSPSAGNHVVWRAPFACTVTNVRGYRVGGSGATINARNEGANDHLSSDLSLTSADTWMDGGAVQNTAYAAGEKLEIMVQSVAGSPTSVVIQVDFTRP